jgi:hypothetical protein
MAEHFGYGEFERADVEVRLSTWFMRHYFLKTLINKKGNWARDLVRLANYKMLPEECHEAGQADYTFYIFLTHFFGHNPHNLNFGSDLLDTPLRAFFTYLEKKKSKIAKLKKDGAALNRIHKTNDIEKAALEQLLPDWKTLKSDQEANHLCALLENWAKEYNLNVEWCLDYALMVLINFKISLSSEMEKFNNNITAGDDIKLHISRFDRHLREAIYAGLNDFRKVKISTELWSAERLDSFPQFVFKHKDFEYPAVTWFPHVTRRKEFVDDQEMKFARFADVLIDLHRNGISYEKDYLRELNAYCDGVERQVSDIEAQSPIFPYVADYMNTVSLHADIYVPSETSREQFIENFIEKLRSTFEKYKKMGKSLESLKKEKFHLALFSYCNKVEKQVPKNFAKIPTKYTEQKHFNWLVDYQVTPVKSYQEIEDSLQVDEEGSVPAIKRAIERLTDSIGLPRRTSPRTGRPPGIKERKTRHRVRK